MITRVGSYECSVCGNEYDTPERAKQCEQHGFNPTLTVGDVVVLPRKSCSSIDGRSEWVYSKKAVDSRTEYEYVLSYVVTHVDMDTKDHFFYSEGESRHRPRYHLRTLALSSEREDASGYTFDRYHFTPKRIETPPEVVVEESEPFLGDKATTLI